MTDQLDDLIKEIAVGHGTAVSRDDPIPLLHTVNRRLLEDSAQAQQAQLERYKEDLEALARRWGNDARDKAERILNASLAAGKEATASLMQEAARVTAATVRLEVDAALVRIAGPVRAARRIALINVVAACVTLAGAAMSFVSRYQ